MSVRVVRHLRHLGWRDIITWARPVHFCFLDRNCRDAGMPKRIYVHILGFYVEWGEEEA